VDGAVRNQSPALDKLTAASQRAFEQRDAAVAELGRCQQGMQQLGQLAKRARELSRHTRLVAFNASIEANRNRTEADGGTQAVAAEVRALSTRIAQTAQEMDQVIATMSESIGAAYLKGQVSDTSPEELRLEIDLNAREAMTALLGNMGGALQSGGQVSQAAQLLKDQLDASFIHFQFGDRVSQMLAIVGNDMSNFVQWVGANPSATQNDAAEWLAALESSYTMDEQRSTHHGNVVVDKSSGVDFF
jgi:methyl-accepting chemotaxis protein